MKERKTTKASVKDMKSRYQGYLSTAVKYYKRDGKSSALCQYFEGIVTGLGFALGYENDDIDSDINEAYAKADQEQTEEHKTA